METTGFSDSRTYRADYVRDMYGAHQTVPPRVVDSVLAHGMALREARLDGLRSSVASEILHYTFRPVDFEPRQAEVIRDLSEVVNQQAAAIADMPLANFLALIDPRR